MAFLNRFVLLSVFILIMSSFFYHKTPETPNLSTLPYESNGNPDSDVTLVFLHGWPNTLRMWDKLIENLKKDYFIINISYPNLAKGVHLDWGMEHEEIAQLIKTTVLDVESKLQPNKINHKRLFIGHDWGSFYNYLVDTHYKGFIQSMVTLDVGAGIEHSIKAKISTVAYQWYLAANFLIGGHIGKIGTKLFVKISSVYGLTEEDSSRIDASWNYFYYYMWKRPFYYFNLLKNYEPSCPTSYVYGKLKPFMFHNEEFLRSVKKTQGEIIEVDEGHWVMNKNYDVVLKTIRKRVEALKNH
jgi:pimeloyl-ACP methyl ester carboxylesterase